MPRKYGNKPAAENPTGESTMSENENLQNDAVKPETVGETAPTMNY